MEFGKGLTKLIRISAEVVFRRALNLSKYREDVRLDTVMGYPFGPVDSSLFNDFGIMHSNQKSNLAKKFKWYKTFYIRDSMALVQAIKPRTGSTVNELADYYIDKVIYAFEYADTVGDVFDRHDNSKSVKAYERANRASNKLDSSKPYQVIGGGTTMGQIHS